MIPLVYLSAIIDSILLPAITPLGWKTLGVLTTIILIFIILSKPADETPSIPGKD